MRGRADTLVPELVSRSRECGLNLEPLLGVSGALNQNNEPTCTKSAILRLQHTTTTTICDDRILTLARAFTRNVSLITYSYALYLLCWFSRLTGIVLVPDHGRHAYKRATTGRISIMDSRRTSFGFADCCSRDRRVYLFGAKRGGLVE